MNENQSKKKIKKVIKRIKKTPSTEKKVIKKPLEKPNTDVSPLKMKVRKKQVIKKPLEKPEADVSPLKKKVQKKQVIKKPLEKPDADVSPLKKKVQKKQIVKKIKKYSTQVNDQQPSPDEAKKKILSEDMKIEKTLKKDYPQKISPKKDITRENEKKVRNDYLRKCLSKVIEMDASDLHLSTGYKPMVRYLGELKALEMDLFTQELADRLINKILTQKQRIELESKMSVDFMYLVEGKGELTLRFRSNVYFHRTGINIVMRIIPNKIPTIRELGMPDIISAFGRFTKGIVIITGSSGSGKTTTLSAILDLVNKEKNAHIITIEDPIEFIHKPERCIVRQRQVGSHTKSFNRALKSSIREDPDIILISEIRDLETIKLALTAAETGCLVLTSMNTTNATRTIDRIIDSFPPDQRLQASAMLSESLKAIVSQQLVLSTDGTCRYPAVEVLLGCTPLISLIREEKTFQINSLIMTSRGMGMQSMDSSLLDLYERNFISKEVALEASLDKSIFDKIDK